jgi:hypothetical protein
MVVAWSGRSEARQIDMSVSAAPPPWAGLRATARQSV